MNKPEYFTVFESHAVFRPVGQGSLHWATQAVACGISFAREQRIRKLLVDIRGLTGFDPPKRGERYFFINDWADAAKGVVSVVIVSVPEMIDPEKFGVTVAANAGLVADVFTTEKEALSWLLGLNSDFTV